MERLRKVMFALLLVILSVSLYSWRDYYISDSKTDKMLKSSMLLTAITIVLLMIYVHPFIQSYLKKMKSKRHPKIILKKMEKSTINNLKIALLKLTLQQKLFLNKHFKEANMSSIGFKTDSHELKMASNLSKTGILLKDLDKLSVDEEYFKLNPFILKFITNKKYGIYK